MTYRTAALLSLILAAGCGQSSSTGGSRRGAAGSPGVSATGGASASAGASSGAAPNAGAPSGGSPNAGAPNGGRPSAGASSSGAPGGAGNGGAEEAGAPTTSGTGGSSAGAGAGGVGANAGSGGSAGTGGSGASGPSPSAACANGDASPETRLPIEFEPRILLPPGYDGSTPAPALFDFHESGGPSMFLNGEVPNDHPLRQRYVVVSPRHPSSFGAFSLEDPAIFVPLFEAVSEAICFDRNNVFVSGLASGARFHNFMLADEQTKHLFRAAVSVGATGGGYNTRAIPHLFIHGLDDTLDAQAGDPDGAKALARYARSNGCDMTSTPRSVASCASGDIEPGCVEYVGCAEPLVFCNHDDPSRGGRNDGWPCFASDLVYEFLEENRL